jgi:hypothetical protein
VLPIINAIWIGAELGQIHAACLRSFLRHGHRVVLHCYERPADTPADVEIANARNLLPENGIVRYRGTGSFALFSNLLRYEILKASLGIYVDCDVFCLRPIEDADYIFGREGILKVLLSTTLFLSCPPAVQHWLPYPQSKIRATLLRHGKKSVSVPSSGSVVPHHQPHLRNCLGNNRSSRAFVLC